MSRKGKTGNGYGIGRVSNRSQFANPVTNLYAKNDTPTCRIMDGETSAGKSKGIRKES